MNKKLIALAVAGALGAPLVASADTSGVTLFGRVQAEYSSTKIDQTPGQGGSTDSTNYRQEVIGDNGVQSRWGLKIHEDLGNGLSAIAQVEYAFSTGAGSSETVREQWVGLHSKSWGEIKVGRTQSPFKDTYGGATLDPFVATALQARGSGGAMYAPANGFGAGGFVDHSIRYNSPDFGGFTASLLLVPSDATQAEGTTGQGNVGGKGGTNNYQIAGKYKFGKVGEVFAGYSKDDASDAQKAVAAAAGNNFRTAKDENVWRIGGKVTFGDFSFGGQYDDINNARSGNGGATCGQGPIQGGGDTGGSTTQCNTQLNVNGDGNIWFVSAQYKLGKTTLIAQGGHTTADAVTNETTGVQTAAKRKASNYTLGAKYSFSKRTTVFGGYQKVNVSGANSYNLGNNTGTGTATLANQPDRSTWTIGLRHDF